MDPNHHLPSYQSGNRPTSKTNQFFYILGWVFGIFFLLAAISALVAEPRLLVAIVFGLLGLLCIPPGHRYIEKKLGIQIKAGATIVSSIILILIAAVLINFL